MPERDDDGNMLEQCNGVSCMARLPDETGCNVRGGLHSNVAGTQNKVIMPSLETWVFDYPPTQPLIGEERNPQLRRHKTSELS